MMMNTKGLTGKHYADAPPGRRTRRQRQAAGFKRDEHLERLVALKERDPASFDRLSPRERMGVGYYLLARTAYREEHRHDDGDD